MSTSRGESKKVLPEKPPVDGGDIAKSGESSYRRSWPGISNVRFLPCDAEGKEMPSPSRSYGPSSSIEGLSCKEGVVGNLVYPGRRRALEDGGSTVAKGLEIFGA